MADFNEGYGIFSKCIHIIDNLGFFIYYKSPNNKNLNVKKGNNNNNTFSEILIDIEK